jgi:hypothetical protein
VARVFPLSCLRVVPLLLALLLEFTQLLLLFRREVTEVTAEIARVALQGLSSVVVVVDERGGNAEDGGKGRVSLRSQGGEREERTDASATASVVIVRSRELREAKVEERERLASCLSDLSSSSCSSSLYIVLNARLGSHRHTAATPTLPRLELAVVLRAPLGCDDEGRGQGALHSFFSRSP